VEPNGVRLGGLGRLGRRQLMRRLGGAAVAAAGAAVAVPALAGVAEAQQSPTTTGGAGGGGATTVSTAAGASGTAGGGSGTSTTAAAGASTTAGAATTTAAATTTTTAPPSKPQPEDLVVLSFANSVELAVVAIYTQALATGRLGADNAKVATRFQAHHRDHAQSFAGMGGKVITNIANQSLVSAYSPRIQGAASEQALLQVLLELETAMASSYTNSISSLVATDPVYLVASILPIEARHAVVYGEKLGAPAPSYLPTFESTSGGFTPAQYPIVES
jgi:Ferritin-like domain